MPFINITPPQRKKSWFSRFRVKFSLERTSERRQAVEKIKGINLTQLKSNLLPSNAHIMSRFLRRGAVGVFSLRGIVWALCQQKWLFFWESKHGDANGRPGKTNPFGQVSLFEGSVIICLTDYFFLFFIPFKKYIKNPFLFL